MNDATIVRAIRTALSDPHLTLECREAIKEQLLKVVQNSPAAAMNLVATVEFEGEWLSWLRALLLTEGRNWPDPALWLRLLDLV